METIRQIITVTTERKIEVTLPDSVKPGLVEMLIVLQSLPDASHSTQASTRQNLFGFLPKRIDPLEFERQIWNEWK